MQQQFDGDEVTFFIQYGKNIFNRIRKPLINELITFIERWNLK